MVFAFVLKYSEWPRIISQRMGFRARLCKIGIQWLEIRLLNPGRYIFRAHVRPKALLTLFTTIRTDPVGQRGPEQLTSIGGRGCQSCKLPSYRHRMKKVIQTTLTRPISTNAALPSMTAKCKKEECGKRGAAQAHPISI